MPRNFALKQRIVQVLKDNEDRLVPSGEIVELVKATGLAGNYVPDANGIAQICRQIKGLSNGQMHITQEGKSYLCKGYFIENEDAFKEWVEKVTTA